MSVKYGNISRDVKTQIRQHPQGGGMLPYRDSLFLTGVSRLGFSYGLDVDKPTAILAFGEYYNAVDQSVDGVVLAHAYVEAGMVNCATLTLDDVTGFAMLTAENLYTESFAF